MTLFGPNFLPRLPSFYVARRKLANFARALGHMVHRKDLYTEGVTK